MTQQGDVRLFQTQNDGDIALAGGVIEMEPGLSTAAYLALFGGNEDDDGSDSNPANWWGNLSETDPAKQYRSETQNLLKSLPNIPVNLRVLREAALRDLAFFTSEGIAQKVSVSLSKPERNRVNFQINIDGQTAEFAANWEASV